MKMKHITGIKETQFKKDQLATMLINFFLPVLLQKMNGIVEYVFHGKIRVYVRLVIQNLECDIMEIIIIEKDDVYQRVW